MDKLTKLAEAIAHHFRYPDENNPKGRSVFEGEGFTLTVDGLSLRASHHIASTVRIRQSWVRYNDSEPRPWSELIGKDDALDL